MCIAAARLARTALRDGTGAGGRPPRRRGHARSAPLAGAASDAGVPSVLRCACRGVPQRDGSARRAQPPVPASSAAGALVFRCASCALYRKEVEMTVRSSGLVRGRGAACGGSVEACPSGYRCRLPWPAGPARILVDVHGQPRDRRGPAPGRIRPDCIYLRDPHADVTPSWSADGRRIAFASDRSGAMEIYLMNADGSGVTQARHTTARTPTPRASPLMAASWSSSRERAGTGRSAALASTAPASGT